MEKWGKNRHKTCVYARQFIDLGFQNIWDVELFEEKSRNLKTEFWGEKLQKWEQVLF